MPEGGLVEAVVSAFSKEFGALGFQRLAVEIMPGSGAPDELMAVATRDLLNR